MYHLTDLLPFFIAPLALTAAVVFTRTLRLWLRILITGLAVLFSFPIGIVVLLGPPAPEIADMGALFTGFLPLLLGWIICWPIWLVGSGLALAGLIERHTPSP